MQFGEAVYLISLRHVWFPSLPWLGAVVYLLVLGELRTSMLDGERNEVRLWPLVPFSFFGSLDFLYLNFSWLTARKEVPRFAKEHLKRREFCCGDDSLRQELPAKAGCGKSRSWVRAKQAAEKSELRTGVWRAGDLRGRIAALAQRTSTLAMRTHQGEVWR